MIEVTHAEASANILRHVAERRLTQGDWHSRDADGREIACLLGAIHPGVESVDDCNGDLMPMEMAEMVPDLFDGLPAEHVYPTAQRFGELVERWHVLGGAQWAAVMVRFRIRCIDFALEAARPVCKDASYWPAVEAACGQVKDALTSGDQAALRAGAAAAGAAGAAYLTLFTFLLDQIEAEIATVASDAQ